MSDEPNGSAEIWDRSGGVTAPFPGHVAASETLPGQLDAPEEMANDWMRLEPRRRLADELRKMRRARKLSQRQLAKMIGLHQSAVGRMESIGCPWPGQEAIAAFAAACGKTAMLVFVDADECEEAFGHDSVSVAASSEHIEKALEAARRAHREIAATLAATEFKMGYSGLFETAARRAQSETGSTNPQTAAGRASIEPKKMPTLLREELVAARRLEPKAASVLLGGLKTVKKA